MAVAEDDSTVVSATGHPAAWKAEETIMRGFTRLLVLVAVGALAFSGCFGDIWEQAQNAAERKQTFEELKQYGLAWMNHHDTHNRGPKNWQDLASFAPAGLQQTLEGKGYQFVWGIDARDMKEGMVNTAIAYPSDAATSGGLILAGDGSVQFVTAEEFNQKFREQIEKRQRVAEERTAIAAAKEAEAALLPKFNPGDMAYVGSRHVVIVAVLPDNNYRVQDVGASGVIVQWVVAAARLAVNPSVAAPPATSAAGQSANSAPPPSPVASSPSTPAPTPSVTTPAADTPQTGGPFERGQKAYAEWAGKWEPVEILEVLAGNQYKIRWTNWGPQWDEVRAGNRLAASAPAGAVASNSPAASGLPRRSSPPPGGGEAPGEALADDATLAAGEKVHAFWLGKWIEAVVVESRGGNIMVRVPPPIPGVPAPEVPLPRHWVRAMAASASKPAESSSPPPPSAPAASAAVSRTWTDSSGKFRIEARFISLAGGQVTLEKPDGVQLRMPLDKLSAADQKFVTEQALRP
jgi:hypothetical protein